MQLAVSNSLHSPIKEETNNVEMRREQKRTLSVEMANTCSYIFLMFLFYGSVLGARTNFLVSDNQSDVPQLVPAQDGICKVRLEIYGYDCQEHTVTTQDGYILSMQRIPVGRSGGTGRERTPVLLQHGLLMDGITWLLNSPYQSLAYILADSGYDVWIANTRGTKYSRGHTSLSADDRTYWQWSWDQLVIYELPALVQYVHVQTGQKLHYVGHSLGTLIALASFSQNNLLDMLRSAALLSPIAHLYQISSLVARAGSEEFVAENLYQSGTFEFNPKGEVLAKLMKNFCSDPKVDCFDLMTPFTGENCCLNSSNAAVFIENEPQSTATKNMMHIAQMVRDGTIAMFDYGDTSENLKHYGQPKPPGYDMARIPKDFPLFLSYGGQDALADPKDVQVLLDDLKDHDGDKLVVQYMEDYAHADFVMGVNAKQVVYDPLMAFFRLQ